MALNTNLFAQEPVQVAIDPSAGIERGMKLRQLALQSQQQEIINKYQPQIFQGQISAAEAALAQQQQATAEQGRQFAGSRRLAEIAKLHTSVDAKTGKLNVNKEGILHQALAEGVPFEAVGSIAKEVATVKEQDLSDETKRQDYTNNRLYELDHLLRVQKTPEAAAGMMASAEQRLAQIVGPEKAKELLASRYGTDPTQVVQRANINASSGISPAQQEQFKISNTQLAQGWANIGVAQQQLIQAGAANLTSPDALDPKSAVSEAYRNLAIRAGAKPEQVQGLNAAQMHRIPGVTELIGSVIPSAPARAEALVASGGYKTDQAIIDQGTSVISNEFRSRYGKPGSITRSLWNQYVEQDPRYAAINAAIEKYNANNPNSKLDILDGFDAIDRRLKIESQRLGSKATTTREVAATPNLSQSAQKTEPQQKPGTPKIGQTATYNGATWIYTGKGANNGWEKK